MIVFVNFGRCRPVVSISRRYPEAKLAEANQSPTSWIMERAVACVRFYSKLLPLFKQSVMSFSFYNVYLRRRDTRCICSKGFKLDLYLYITTSAKLEHTEKFRAMLPENDLLGDACYCLAMAARVMRGSMLVRSMTVSPSVYLRNFSILQACSGFPRELGKSDGYA